MGGFRWSRRARHRPSCVLVQALQRLKTVRPAALDLQVDLDLLSEVASRVMLSPDSMAERPFLPEVDELKGELLLADRGYCSSAYRGALDGAGGKWMIRGKANVKPEVVAAFDAADRPLHRWFGRGPDELGKALRKHAWPGQT